MPDGRHNGSGRRRFVARYDQSTFGQRTRSAALWCRELLREHQRAVLLGNLDPSRAQYPDQRAYVGPAAQCSMAVWKLAVQRQGYVRWGLFRERLRWQSQPGDVGQHLRRWGEPPSLPAAGDCDRRNPVASISEQFPRGRRRRRPFLALELDRDDRLLEQL